MTQLHPNIKEALIDGLDRCLNQGYHAAKVVEWNLKNHKKWGSRDRRLFAKTLYEVVRWRSRLAYAALADDQQARELLQAWLALEDGSADAELRARWDDPLSDQMRHAMPDWLQAAGLSQYGTNWYALAAVLNTQAPLFLRANSLKADQQAVLTALANEGVEVRARRDGGLGDSALQVIQRQNVFTTQAFKDGLFEVQDLGSQDIAPFLQLEPGMRVIDACAGGGGKALHAVAMMENRGKLLAMDIHQWKLDALRKRAKRAGVHCIETRLIESSKTIKRLDGSADRLLLDVPCSGSGVLRRKPDTKWKVGPENLVETQDLQADILQRYSRMTRPGGKMVYATCSILEAENQAQVARFLESNPGWSLEEEAVRLPERGGSDGFYMARLLRQPEERAADGEGGKKVPSAGCCLGFVRSWQGISLESAGSLREAGKGNVT